MPVLTGNKSQRQTNANLYLAAIILFPGDLIDVLYVNHEYGAIHFGLGTIIKVVCGMAMLLLPMTIPSRLLQRVSADLLLVFGGGYSVLLFLGVKASDTQLVGKSLVWLFWIPVSALLADWLAQKFSKPLLERSSMNAPNPS
jgi:hypothetical protein